MTRLRPLIAAVLLAVGCNGPRPLTTTAGPLSITVDRTRAAVAEPVRMTLTAPAGRITEWPAWPGQHGDLFLTSAADVVRGTVQDDQVLVWEAFDSGRSVIPAAAFTLNDGTTATTPEIQVAVRSAVGLFDTMAPLQTDIPLRLPWWVWTIGSVAFAAIIFVLGRRVVRRLTGRPRSPLEQLARLREAARDGSLPHRDIVEQSLHIIRRQLAAGGLANAANLSTSELITAEPVRSHDNRETLARFLRRSDAVRFAGDHATLEDARDAVAAAALLIPPTGGDPRAAT